MKRFVEFVIVMLMLVVLLVIAAPARACNDGGAVFSFTQPFAQPYGVQQQLVYSQPFIQPVQQFGYGQAFVQWQRFVQPQRFYAQLFRQNVIVRPQRAFVRAPFVSIDW